MSQVLVGIGAGIPLVASTVAVIAKWSPRLVGEDALNDAAHDIVEGRRGVFWGAATTFVATFAVGLLAARATVVGVGLARAPDVGGIIGMPAAVAFAGCAAKGMRRFLLAV